jgi:H+/Cl- antiporter ClcA
VIPVPCGIFVPVLAAGSILGRLFGEVLKEIVSGDPSYVIVPGTKK